MAVKHLSGLGVKIRCRIVSTSILLNALTVRRAGVECTGSYGAALARHLRAAGIEVIEVNQPDKATRRRQGKTDTLDAGSAARAVLSGRASATAKAGDGPVEMLRMFKLAKVSAVKARTQAINQLKAVLVAADPTLRETLSGLSNVLLIRRCTQLDVDTPCDTTSAAAYTLQLLARRILALTSQIRELEHQITTAITSHASRLLTRRSVPTTQRPCSSPLATTPTGCVAKPPLPRCAASARWKHPRAKPAVAASTVVATAKPIARSTASPCHACAGTPAPATTSPAASPTAKPAAKPSAASSATSPARSTKSSRPHPKLSHQPLDIHRGISAVPGGGKVSDASIATCWATGNKIATAFRGLKKRRTEPEN